MANECAFEFSFRRKDLEKLLADNPKSQLILVKTEIKSVSAGGKKRLNVMTATASAKSSGRKTAVALKSSGDITSSIEGCPYPPGCTIDSE